MSQIFSNFYQEIHQFQKYIKNTPKKYPQSNHKKIQGKENLDNIDNTSDDYMKTLENKSFAKKIKKVFTQKKYKVNQKVYYKNGKGIKFNLFKEKEIGLNEWDKKINILESEEDYDSDENVIKDGKARTKNDIIEALRLFKNNKFKDIMNYSKYCKYTNNKI